MFIFVILYIHYISIQSEKKIIFQIWKELPGVWNYKY